MARVYAAACCLRQVPALTLPDSSSESVVAEPAAAVVAVVLRLGHSLVARSTGMDIATRPWWRL